MIQECAYSPSPSSAAPHRYIMSCVTAAYQEFRHYCHKIVFIPPLIRIAKYKIKGTFQLWDQIVPLLPFIP